MSNYLIKDLNHGVTRVYSDCMAFVKLDCGMLDSTIWIDRDARELFVTALLMAVPMEFSEPVPQLKVRSLELTGFVAPPRWYGFVAAAGPGIIRRAMVDPELGLAALERLGEPEAGSRSSDFDGRRLIRVDGGYLVLNYDRYRNKDHTAAARSQRYRDKKKKDDEVNSSRVSVMTSRVASRSVTQAEAEAYSNSSPKAQKRESPRNLLMDELAKVDGIPLTEIGTAVAKRLNKILSAIKESSPDVTPEEIQRRVGNYRLKFPEATMTAQAVAKWWPSLGEAELFHGQKEQVRIPENLRPGYVRPEEVSS